MKKVLIIGGLGYIGSRVYRHLALKGYNVQSVDLGFFVTPEISSKLKDIENLKTDFHSLTEDYVRLFDVVIHLAGHTSVEACNKSPRESFRNNCLNFFHLAGKIGKKQQFIYASSGSVYNNPTNKEFILAKEDDKLLKPTNSIDNHKQIADFYMDISAKRFYGLRLGTVCGFSEVPRNELMVNAMVKSALQSNLVDATNARSYRSILGMGDLCRSIETIIDTPEAPSGFYNLASYSAKIGDIGETVADYFRANFSSNATGSNPYSYALGTAKFKKTFKFEFHDTAGAIIESASRNNFSIQRDWTKVSIG